MGHRGLSAGRRMDELNDRLISAQPDVRPTSAQPAQGWAANSSLPAPASRDVVDVL